MEFGYHVPHIESLEDIIKQYMCSIGYLDYSAEVAACSFALFHARELSQIFCVKIIVDGHEKDRLEHVFGFIEKLLRVPMEYDPQDFLPLDLIRPQTLWSLGDGTPILFEGATQNGDPKTEFIIDINKLMTGVYPNIEENHVLWCHDSHDKLIAVPSLTDIRQCRYRLYKDNSSAANYYLCRMIEFSKTEEELSTLRSIIHGS